MDKSQEKPYKPQIERYKAFTTETFNTFWVYYKKNIDKNTKTNALQNQVS